MVNTERNTKKTTKIIPKAFDVDKQKKAAAKEIPLRLLFLAYFCFSDIINLSNKYKGVTRYACKF